MKKLLVFGAALTLAACANEQVEEDPNNQTEETEEAVDTEDTGETEETQETDGSDDTVEVDGTEGALSLGEEPSEPNEEDLISEVNGFRMYENTELMDRIETVEANLQSEYENGDYTDDNPFVVLDPYDVAPLSALIAFETEIPTQVRYSVVGKTEDTTISNTIDDYKTEHEFPVFGLYADYDNTVEIEMTDESGETLTHEVEITTEALPEDYWELDLVESTPEEMHPGLTFLNTSQGEYFAVDSDGEVRFLLKPWMSNNVEHMRNGHFAIVLRRAHDPEVAHQFIFDHIVELDYLGKPYNSYIFDIDVNDSAVPLDHDIIELDNGNMLVLAHDGDSEYVEDAMFEFDMETGEIVNETDFKEIFPADYYEDYQFEGEDSMDWLHHNSVYQTSDGESVLISGRNHDLVFKMTYPGLELEWIMTTDDNWEDTTRPDDYLLEPVGEGKFQMGQHAVEEMPDQDGNPNTMDIMLFDNNRYVKRGDEEEAEKYSRAVQYRIDEENMTVEEIWSYGEERGEGSYSDIVSDADYLEESNNVLLDFGRTYPEDENTPVSQIVEVDKETKEVLFEYHVTQPEGADRRQIYRAERMPIYPENFEFAGIIFNDGQ